jgi:TPR repeat protein
MEGVGGVAKDEVAAVEWYRKASDRGHAGAQAALGMCFARGTAGIPQSYQKAVELFQLAAAQDHPSACFNLGQCLLKGNGIKQDEAAGKELIAKGEKLMEGVRRAQQEALQLAALSAAAADPDSKSAAK